MNPRPAIDRTLLIEVLLLSAILVVAMFLWEGNKGYSLWDEGYLWYGAQRVLHGDVPIRDFMAYDPGRYYWAAAFMWLFDDHGIMALRASVAIFELFGIAVGFWLIASAINNRSKADFGYLVLSGLIILTWTFPRHKLFDISISIFLMGVLSFLASHPTPRRYLLSGIFVGLAAVFGRNHGVYGLIGVFCLTIWLHLGAGADTKPGFIKSCGLLGVGVLLGFLPIILAMLFVPDFAPYFWDSIRFIFDQKSTNIPLPIPWPWKVNLSTGSVLSAAPDLLVGIFFIAILVCGVLALAWVFYRRLKGKPVRSELVAASVLVLPYAHYAFSRADASHLAQGIEPLIIGFLIILAASGAPARWSFAAALLAVSILAVGRYHSGWQCAKAGQCVELEVSGDRLEADPGTASDVGLLRRLAGEYAKDGRGLMAAPFWPGAYALLERKSPVWEIYPVFSRPAAFQEAEISRLKADPPGFVIIIDQALDGQDKFLYKNSHPLIYKYIVDNYKRLDYPENSSYQIYVDRR